MSSSLGSVLVSAATYGLLGSIFTRDAFFSGFTFLAFWLFIFAPTFYMLVADTYFYIPAIVAVASVVGMAIVKLLSIGQLVDVWMTGAGGGDNSAREELNVPFMVLAVAFSFFATFFAIAAYTGAAFLGGLFVLSSSTAGWLLFGVFAALTLAAVLATGIQRKRGVRFKGIHDWASVYYTFVFVLVAFVPALVWHYTYPASPVMVAAYRGLFAGGTAIVVDIIFLGLGAVYEAWRDRYIDYTGSASAKVYTRHGRFYSHEGSKGLLAARFIVVPLVHAGIYILGGYAVCATGDVVADIFWSPWLIVYFAVAFLVFAGLYVVILVFFTWQDYFADNGGDVDASTPLVGDTDQAMTPFYDDKSDSPPLPPPSSLARVDSTRFADNGAPISARTRRRTPAGATTGKKASSSDNARASLDFDY